MIPVLSRDAMRAFDARAIDAGVPGIVLMENAGRGAAERILGRIGGRRDARVVIVCGTGNNGGDGFVVARHLAAAGLEPRAILVGEAERLKGDARLAYDAYRAVAGTAFELPNEIDVADAREALSQADVVVDALFGTGLDRAIAGAAAELVEALSAPRCLRVALDIPSGLDANTGTPLGPAVIADVTLTFAHLKLGLLTPRGRAHAGVVEVVGIGVPAELPSDLRPAAELVETRDIAGWLSPRGADAHKYSAGHVAVLGGSSGKLGAAVLCGEAALHGGAGAATIVTRADVAAKLEARVRELMVAALDADIGTSLDRALEGKKAVVMGPGLGLDATGKAIVEHVLSTYLGPLVLDADALTHFAGRAEAIASGPQRARVLTPHGGEAARLLGMTSSDVEQDRFAAAARLAQASESIVVLKGAHSVVAGPDGRTLIGPLGSASLATAGSGDVLAGILGAMIATLPPLEAAAAAVATHAEAGRRWEERHADRGLLAGDIASTVPDVIGELLRLRAGAASPRPPTQ